MRNTLSPAFTSSKLRFMYESIYKCAQQNDIYLLKEMEKQKANGQRGSYLFIIYFLICTLKCNCGGYEGGWV